MTKIWNNHKEFHIKRVKYCIIIEKKDRLVILSVIYPVETKLISKRKVHGVTRYFPIFDWDTQISKNEKVEKTMMGHKLSVQ